MLNFFLRIERKFLVYLLSSISFIGKGATKRFFKINNKLTATKYKDVVETVLASQEVLLAKAKKYSEYPNLSDAEKEMVYYYFLIKHFIAEHETRAVKIPLQVFSEHRMALDHIIRAKISNNENIKNNLDKAIGHLRRALLDSIKVNCSELKKEIDKRHEAIPKKSLGLISNGDYIKEFIKWQRQAEDMLSDARYEEYKLGDKVSQNIEVINLFVIAFLAHKKWYQFQADNLGNAFYNTARYYAIKGWALVVTSAVSCFIGYAWNYILDHSFFEFIKKVLITLGL